MLLTSSRGVGLHSLIKDEVLEWGGLTTEVISGGQFSDIAKSAKSLLSSSFGPNSSPRHVYILAGIPDFTTLVKDYSSGKCYKESILIGTQTEIIERVKNEIDACSETIRDAGGRPIFCTITNTNISQYNHYLLEHNIIHTLLHTQEYDHMQPQLDEILSQVNEYILAHNQRYRMATPHCHSAIRKHKGRAGEEYYFFLL